MSITVANQYARALLDVVSKEGSGISPADTLVQLQTFCETLDVSAELKEVLMTPAVGAQAKRRALGRVAALMGLSPVVVNFLSLVKDRRRVALLPDICLAFRDQMDARLGIVRARVASARPLSGAQQKDLIERLQRATGKTVDVDCSVDPALVGGATVAIGSTVYDGSVRGQLEGLRRRMTSEG